MKIVSPLLRGRFCFVAGIAFCIAVILPGRSQETNYPTPVQGDFVIKDFHFESGETLPELTQHYMTIGTLERDAQGHARNAVLIMHGTTGTGAQFLRKEFADVLYGKGQPLDAMKYFIILPDGIGHGQSSRPSEGLHAKFPHYGYRDMIEAQYQMLMDGLKVDHLRLVMGTSMGGMHTWLWGEEHPDYMDALMPLASLPGPIAGRNRMWRRIVIDSIRNSCDWQNGDYTAQPSGLRVAGEIMYVMGSNPAKRYQEAPTLEKADQLLDAYVSRFITNYDANNVMYAFQASQDYDPAPDLEKITAPLVAINSADDLINPPDQGILEREIKRVKNGQAVVIPESEKTSGHGTHTSAAVWENYLIDLLKRTEK